MTNYSGWRGRQARSPGPRQENAPGQAASSRQAAAARQTGRRAGTPAFTEPEVRRWPHPVTGAEVPPSPGPAPGQVDAALYYIHCALSYQNQLLADITALLEQLVADSAAPSEEDSRFSSSHTGRFL